MTKHFAMRLKTSGVVRSLSSGDSQDGQKSELRSNLNEGPIYEAKYWSRLRGCQLARIAWTLSPGTRLQIAIGGVRATDCGTDCGTGGGGGVVSSAIAALYKI